MPESTISNTHVLQPKTPPGPRGHWLLGCLPEVQRDSLNFLISLARDYGDIVKYRFIHLPGYFVSHPDYIKHILQDNNQNYTKQTYDYRMLKPVLGEGLLTSDGSYWLSQRRLIQPAFHKQRINAFGALMSDQIQEMLARWQAPAFQDRPFDLAGEMTRLTLGIVGKALFSLDISGEADVVGKAFALVNEDISSRFRTLFSPPLSWPVPRNRRFHSAMRALDEVVGSIIQERRKALAAGKEQHAEDLLSMLLRLRNEETGEGLDDRQLRDEVMTLLLAGHETTANALSWTWYLLSKHPGPAQRLYAELDTVLGTSTPSVADLRDLPYTRMVIQESMRLYPPAWIISRLPAHDDMIDGYLIQAKIPVHLSAYVTHRHPAFWEHPDDFEPERFSPERSAGRQAYAYFPFGGGPRQCIGRDFAMLEAQLVLASVVQRYHLDLVPGHPIEPDPLITLRPKYGLMMTLRPRRT